jgi:hypothetical protein
VSRQIRTLIAAAAALLACGAGVGIPTTNARAADCLTAPYFSAAEGSYWSYRTDRATKRKCWFLRAKNQSTQQPTEQTASEAGPGAGATNTAGADDCLTAPDSPASEGRRWFYRTDRATQRKCWYLRAAGEPAQRAANVQAPSAVAPAKTTSAFDNATASAGAPLSKSSAEGPSPSLKPQPSPMGGTTTADLVAQSAPTANTSPSSRERPAQQTGAQAAGPAPAAGSPSPAVATANATKPNVTTSDARTDSLRPTVGARARDDAASPARGGASTANATGMAMSSTGTLVQMFLIVVAGLGTASLLYRVVTAAARRRQNSNDHLEADSIGDQKARDNQQQYRSVDEGDQLVDDLHPSTMAGANVVDDQRPRRSGDDGEQFIEDLHGSQLSAAIDRDNQQHHRSVDEPNQFIDDLHRSLIPGANDYDAPRPHPTDDVWQNNAPRAGGDVSEREDTLAQLRRDLDRLLHPNSHEDNGRRAGGESQITGEVSERDYRLTQWRRDLDLLLQPRKSA